MALKFLKKNDFEPRVLYSAKLTFKFGAKYFFDFQGLRRFINHRPFLKEVLKDVLQQNEIGIQKQRKNSGSRNKAIKRNTRMLVV